MKRVAFFGALVVVVASAWTILHAQTRRSTARDAFASAQAAPPTFDRDAGRNGLTPLRHRFVELSTRKARLMTEEQLQQAVNELDRDVDGLNAWSKIEAGARLLREVVEKHPRTKAAEAAKSALKAIEERRQATEPVGPREERNEDPFVPRPPQNPPVPGGPKLPGHGAPQV